MIGHPSSPTSPRLALPLLIALLFITASLLPAPAEAGGKDRPEQILSKRLRILPPERYAELREEWSTYTGEHPEDPVGWSELARAARYAGTDCDTYIDFAKKGVDLGPDIAHTHATLGSFCWQIWCGTQEKEPTRAIRELETALALDSTIGEPHFSLWVMKLSEGNRAAAAEHLRAILDGGHLPDLLVDLAYNMLVALPPDAIVLTNGDNDTYPPLALQAARGFRTDVAIVNLSLLNLHWYRKELRDGPLAVPVPLLEEKAKACQSGKAVDGLIEKLAGRGWKRPLFIAATVDLRRVNIGRNLSLEGILYRVLPQNGEETETNVLRLRKNLEDLYRLDSATSLSFDWDYYSALPPLVMNYAAAHAKLAAALVESEDLEGAREHMRKAIRLYEFHGRTDLGRSLAENWIEWDPNEKEPRNWAERL